MVRCTSNATVETFCFLLSMTSFLWYICDPEDLAAGCVGSAGQVSCCWRTACISCCKFDSSEISLYLDGQQQYALKPLQPNTGNDLYVRTYNTLFAGTCKLNRDEGNFISREDYANGYALYAFDLTADLAEDDHFNLVKHGSVRLAMRFSQALPPTVSAIAYAEFDNIIEIDRDRNLLLDFGVWTWIPTKFDVRCVTPKTLSTFTESIPCRHDLVVY